jgi:endonuclease G
VTKWVRNGCRGDAGRADGGHRWPAAEAAAAAVQLGGAGVLFGAFKTYQRSVLAIEGLTDLDFGELHHFDGFSNEENATGEVVRALISGPSDIRV